MTNSEEREGQSRRPAKTGLHGWKAGLAVFGCGTLAAFGVFGVIVGALGLFLGGISSGVNATAAEGNRESVVPEQTIKPKESLDYGALDLCGKTIPGADGNQVRTDAGGAYVDSGEEAAPRIVSDRCDWNVIPASSPNSRWTMKFEYAAFVVSGDGGPASEEADDEFEGRVSDVEDLQLEGKTSGDARVADRSHFVHGVADSGATIYVLVGRTGDTVYEMTFETGQEYSDGSLVPIGDFETERNFLVDYIVVRLGIVGP
ncbi:hypothetical protein [Nocardiopsis sp. NPDC006938]|uniref:hypothetical protein n=1 Tax=Nocardiopsis sp. NPDC006938 TaxID=3364337 RepID=UPI0036BED3A2